MFKFLPISLQIKKKEWRPGYDRALQYVETDEGDLTYFLSYKTKLASSAIEDFITYLKKKQKDANRLKGRLVANEKLNPRQLELIDVFQRAPNGEIDIRTDLFDLVSKRILKPIKVGKKYLFSRGDSFPSV